MLRIKLFIIGLIGASMLMTSCDPDSSGGGGIGGGNANAPFVDIFDDGSGTNLTFDSTVEPGQVFRIAIDALANDAELNAVRVLRDGFSLEAQGANDEFDNLDVEDLEEQNPQLLSGANRDAFTWTFEFTAPLEEGDFVYEFEVSDAANLSTSTSLTVTVFQTVADVDPMITLNGPASIVTAAGTLNSFNIDAVMGTNEFESISVWEDGSLITDLSRIRFMGDDFEFNPLPLFSPESLGFSGAVIIQAIAGNHDYVIRVTDTEGNNADAMFTVIDEATLGTDLTSEFDFILFSNASGPDNGGLDLDNGVAVPSASADAEIRDLGIDTNMPAATNWIQRIEGVNGSDLRIVDLFELPDGFSFDGVDTKEAIQLAFDTGSPANPSPVLQVGDLFTVSNFSNTYILRVDEVNVTDGDNNDFYRFSIKF